MNVFRVILMISVCIGLASFVRAEFRPWTDVKGNSIEAEYVRTAAEQVVMRKRDGAEIKVPLDLLCDEDRTYAMLQCPPQIEIQVDDRLDRTTIGYSGRGSGSSKLEMQSIKTEVSLRKTSAERYEPELTLTVCLVGRMDQLDRYVIIDSKTSTFSFNDENKGLFIYTCEPVDLRNVSGNRRIGTEYEGYILSIRDARGEAIALKTNRLEFEKHAAVILEAEKGAVFDDDFNAVHTEKKKK